VITDFQAEPSTYGLTLANAVLAALPGRRNGRLSAAQEAARPRRIEGGLTLVFGVGLIAQVFTGLQPGRRRVPPDLWRHGRRRPIGPGAAMLDLMVGLCHGSLPDCPADRQRGRGILVVRSVSGAPRQFWLAAGIYAGFSWVIVAAQLAIGGENPATIMAGQASLLTSTVTVAYYLAAIALAYGWLRRALASDPAGAGAADRRLRRGR
jgi:hypothetical protein